MSVGSGVARKLCTGGPEYRGAEFEMPKASRGRGMGRGYSLPSQLGSLGERCKLPQRGPGRSPGRKRVFVHFELEKNESGDDKFDIFVSLKMHIKSHMTHLQGYLYQLCCKDIFQQIQLRLIQNNTSSETHRLSNLLVVHLQL